MCWWHSVENSAQRVKTTAQHRCWVEERDGQYLSAPTSEPVDLETSIQTNVFDGNLSTYIQCKSSDLLVLMISMQTRLSVASDGRFRGTGSRAAGARRLSQFSPSAVTVVAGSVLGYGTSAFYVMCRGDLPDDILLVKSSPRAIVQIAIAGAKIFGKAFAAAGKQAIQSAFSILHAFCASPHGVSLVEGVVNELLVI